MWMNMWSCLRKLDRVSVTIGQSRPICAIQFYIVQWFLLHLSAPLHRLKRMEEANRKGSAVWRLFRPPTLFLCFFKSLISCHFSHMDGWMLWLFRGKHTLNMVMISKNFMVWFKEKPTCQTSFKLLPQGGGWYGCILLTWDMSERTRLGTEHDLIASCPTSSL